MRKAALFFIGLLFFFSAPSVQATTVISGDLQLSYDSTPLFPSSILWYPGDSVTKSFTVKNIGTTNHTVSLQAVNTSQTGGIASVFLFKISEGGSDIYGAGGTTTMQNFWDEGQINLTDLSGGATMTYDLTIAMDVSAGNEYQNQQAIFDLTIGFVGTPSQITIPGAGPGGASPTVCTDVKPALPANFSASAAASVGQINLVWSAPTPPYTYFLIAYSDTPAWPAKWGNPDVGNVTSFTVSGLASGQYWFWLRAGNGCMPGDFVGPVTPGAIAGVAGAATAAGFIPGVLGVTVPEGSAAGIPEGEVKGLESKPICWWWLILSLLTALILVLVYWLGGKRLPGYWWILPIILAILAYIGDHYLAHLFYTPSPWCAWMWLWATLAAGLPSLIYWQTRQ